MADAGAGDGDARTWQRSTAESTLLAGSPLPKRNPRFVGLGSRDAEPAEARSVLADRAPLPPDRHLRRRGEENRDPAA